jgi:hypothetical protein
VVKVTLYFVVSSKGFGHFLTVFTREAVDDAALPSETSVQQVGQVLVKVVQTFFVTDFIH